MVKRRCLLLLSTAPACTHVSSWTHSQGLVRDVNHCMLSVIDWIQLAALDVDSLDFEDNPTDDISCSQGEAFSCRQIGSCIDRMCLTVTCAFHFQQRLLRFSVWSSAVLAWARLLASSSSCGAPERSQPPLRLALDSGDWKLSSSGRHPCPFCSLAFPLTLVLPSSSLCSASRSNRGLHECVVFLEHLRGVEFIKELKEPSISGLCFSIEADMGQI
ncbi:hypothetical protein F2Q68_00034675 [Brassica cretica]|uniref:Secreted protein n=1 Tax=Brassica cretica TaxID=69181 RepID=A0A8S9H6S4_BRACR|nr:hypothetical protein F2Q68_00034675 [Brassica cretica]